MALTPKLELRQSQALVMTPQLMQAIKLLQLSNLDLAAYVEGELERNPLLERAADSEAAGGEGGDGASDRADEGAPAVAPPHHDGADGELSAGELEVSRAALEEKLDTDLENVFPDDDGTSTARLNAEPHESAAHWAIGGRNEEYNLEAFVSAETTLAEHLAGQLALAVSDPVRRMIGQYLIDLVDESGYLVGDLADVADKLGAPLSEVEAVLALLQGFDPPGVCARNLAECLSIQLKERNRCDPAMAALLANLDLLAKRDFPALRRICGVSEEDLADMVAEIRRLNPKPGLAFGSAVVQPIVPDVYVRTGAGGGYVVELNSDTLPKVLVNHSYYAEISRAAVSEKEKAFLAESLQSATWLVRALDQRAKTILKVAIEIVRQQDAFFAHGVTHLRPLNLKTVADAIGMHESTVSRVTANKYMATERGIFEMKYFFSSAIAAADGGAAHSAEAVRHHIKRLIDDESPDDILSDDAIVEKLRAAGIDIARRTVAKYREAMHIPSSVQRRREKRARARFDAASPLRLDAAGGEP